MKNIPILNTKQFRTMFIQIETTGCIDEYQMTSPALLLMKDQVYYCKQRSTRMLFKNTCGSR